MGLEVDSPDKVLLRLEALVRDKTDPRLAGVLMEWIPLDGPRGAIIMRIPASLAAPHRVRINKSGPFYGRDSRGKFEMDAQELRQAFTQADALPQRIRDFHARAVQMAAGLDMPFRVDPEPHAVVSTVPLAFFREARDLPFKRENVQVPVAVTGGVESIYTLEGVLLHTPCNEAGHVRSYALTHRGGRVDVVWTIGGVREFSRTEQHLVWPQRFERGLMDAAGSATVRLREQGVEGPWVVLATIVGVEGYQLVLGDRDASRPAWRDTALIGEIVVDQVTPETMLPLLKAFWLLFSEQRPADRAI